MNNQTLQTSCGCGGGKHINTNTPVPPNKPKNLRAPPQEEDQQQDIVDWDLTDEDALSKGSNLSGNKALMEDYPENETNSKKTKKTNTGKGKKATPSPRNERRRQTMGAR